MIFVGYFYNFLINDFDNEDEGLYFLFMDDFNILYYVVKSGL